jgi:hypothetical protein
MNKSKQRTGRNRDGMDLGFGFVIMESPVSIGLVSGTRTPSDVFSQKRSGLSTFFSEFLVLPGEG